MRSIYITYTQNSMLMKMLHLLIWYLALPTRAGFFVGREDTSPIFPSSLLTRQLSHHELNSKIWSQGATVLQANNGVRHILHNYTVDDQIQTGRWTWREQTSRHQRRAYGISNEVGRRMYAPFWAVRPSVPGREAKNVPVFILLCFEGPGDQDKLESAVSEAICRWDTALGPGLAGVRFAWELAKDGSKVCKKTRRARAGVTIVIRESELGETTVGKQTIKPVNSMAQMAIDPALYPMADGYSLASAITQQLGHVLGLRKEYQRPDALAHFHFWCDRVPGYTALTEFLGSAERVVGAYSWVCGAFAPLELDINDLCDRGELSLHGQYSQWWKGEKWTPFSDFPMEASCTSYGVAGVRSVHNTITEQKMYGNLDTQSVMWACGPRLRNDRGQNIWTTLWDQPIECPVGLDLATILPSAQDVAAIDLLYPPIQSPLPPDFNLPGHQLIQQSDPADVIKPYCRALHDYTAQQPGEMSVVARFVYDIEQKVSNEFWLLSEVDGSASGLVPAWNLEDITPAR